MEKSKNKSLLAKLSTHECIILNILLNLIEMSLGMFHINISLNISSMAGFAREV